MLSCGKVQNTEESKNEISTGVSVMGKNAGLGLILFSRLKWGEYEYIPGL